MIKIIMIIVFIFVGLIYDWGGVRGHPGPVSTVLPRVLPSAAAAVRHRSGF